MKTISLLLLASCAATSHPVAPASFGTPRSLADLEAVIDQPGPLTLDSVASADWAVPLSGMLNLEKAKLEDREEPIQVFAHVVTHPSKGAVWIDSGVERDARHLPSWSSLVFKTPLQVKKPAGDIAKPSAVFLTHLHFDHIMGLPDLDKATPIYIGHGELEERQAQNLLMRGTFDTYLDGFSPLQELPAGEVLDLFGDGSLWAIAVPGHTNGSLAFVARTKAGAVLLTGDACHTRYGWEHGIEPGSFSADKARSAGSLATLRALAKRHPAMQVRLGHQQ